MTQPTNQPNPSGMEGPELTDVHLFQQARRTFEAGNLGPEALAAALDLASAIQYARPDRGAWPVARAITDITEPLPTPLLSARGLSGAVLSAGEVCLLAGGGGVGKSLLTCSTALGFAMAPETGNTLPGRIFDGNGGPVLMAVYEDRPAVIAHRLRNLAMMWAQRADNGILGNYSATDVHQGSEQIFVVDMRGWPLYGAPPNDPSARQPIRLDGLSALDAAARGCGARLVIIDPALSAFTGESNAAGPVRSFLGELGQLAERIDAGALVVAHSTKAARIGGDPYEPGQVGGSGAWADGCRGVLTLTTQKDRDTEGDTWTSLAISKANWGPAFRALPLTPIEYAPSGDGGRTIPVGYEAAASEWATGNPKPGGAPAPREHVPAGHGHNGRRMPNV